MRDIDKHLTKAVVRPFFVAKISAWIKTELSADSFVGCNVIWIAFLVKDWVVGQSTLTLNSSQLKQYFSCRVVNMKKIEGMYLWGKGSD